jgi:hypothetical protein
MQGNYSKIYRSMHVKTPLESCRTIMFRSVHLYPYTIIRTNYSYNLLVIVNLESLYKIKEFNREQALIFI